MMRRTVTVRVELDKPTFETIERATDRADADEETVGEWVHGAIRRRAVEDFC